jgi:hypothetical protein
MILFIHKGIVAGMKEERRFEMYTNGPSFPKRVN